MHLQCTKSPLEHILILSATNLGKHIETITLPLLTSPEQQHLPFRHPQRRLLGYFLSGLFHPMS